MPALFLQYTYTTFRTSAWARAYLHLIYRDWNQLQLRLVVFLAISELWEPYSHVHSTLATIVRALLRRLAILVVILLSFAKVAYLCVRIAQPVHGWHRTLLWRYLTCLFIDKQALHFGQLRPRILTPNIYRPASPSAQVKKVRRLSTSRVVISRINHPPTHLFA